MLQSEKAAFFANSIKAAIAFFVVRFFLIMNAERAVAHTTLRTVASNLSGGPELI